MSAQRNQPAGGGCLGSILGGVVGLCLGGGLGFFVAYSYYRPQDEYSYGIVSLIGTAIGALVGGIIGSIGGAFAGRKMGSRRMKRTFRGAALTLAFAILAVAWRFAGYEPTRVATLRGLQPVAVIGKRDAVVAAAKTDYVNLFQAEGFGPIRMLDLKTGRDLWPSLPLVEPDDLARTIMDLGLSDDESLLFVVRRFDHPNYHLTVIDLAAGSIVLEQSFPFDELFGRSPSAAFSPDNRLLAWETTYGHQLRTVVVWNLAEQRENYRLPDSYLPAFSPDGKQLATRGGYQPDDRASSYVRFQVWNAATGKKIHNVKVEGQRNSWNDEPRFSPDGKHLAAGFLDNGQEMIEIIDLERGLPCFETRGWSPQFLPDGHLMAVRSSDQDMAISGNRFKIPEIVIWNSTDWRDPRHLLQSGASLLSGPILPRPWPVRDGESRIGVVYDTGGDLAGMSTLVSGKYSAPFFGAGRALKLNIRRGLGMDIIDVRSGATRTHHLDGAMMYSPFPDQGKIFVYQPNDVIEIWDIPPRRNYAAVAVTAGLLAAIGAAGFAVRILKRLLRRRQANVVASQSPPSGNGYDDDVATHS